MIAFVDTETLGLDADLHAMWEVAAILWDPGPREVLAERVWQLRLTDVEVLRADPIALEIGRFSERRWPDSHCVSRATFAPDFAAFADGCHLAGAVPSFDEERLRRLLRAEGVEHRWHYHLIDVEALAIGFLHGRSRGHREAGCAPPPAPPSVARELPWASGDLTTALGVEIPEETKHTALGDARWALAIWEAVTCPE